MQSNEKSFDQQLAEIGDLYEGMKSDFLACSMPAIYTAKELATKQARFYESLKRLRDIAAMKLRNIHDIEEN